MQISGTWALEGQPLTQLVSVVRLDFTYSGLHVVVPYICNPSGFLVRLRTTGPLHIVASRALFRQSSMSRDRHREPRGIKGTYIVR